MEELKKTPRTGMEAAGQQTGLSLAEAEKRIVQSAAGSMIEIGYYLKQICKGQHCYPDRDKILA